MRSMRCLTRCRQVAVGLLSTLLLACGSADSTGEDPAYRPLEPGPSFCQDCIRLDSVVTLGDTTGEGYVRFTEYVVRDGRGNFWAGQYDDMLKVFDSDGTFLRRVGRPGQGPMEFGSPRPFFSDDSGRVHVFDPHNARLSIIGPDFELHDEAPLPALVRAAAPIPGTNAIVVNGPISTGNGTLLPIHILENLEAVHSFGRKGASGARNTFGLLRRIATGPGGRIYTAPRFEYRVDVWTSEGRRVDGIVGSELNEVDPPEEGPASFTRENPPPNYVSAMRVDGENRLWVLLHVRNRDWEDHMLERPARGGGVRLVPDNGVGSIWHTRIDVVDLDSASLLARSRRDEMLIGFVADDLVFENRRTAEVYPRLVVWRIGLESGG